MSNPGPIDPASPHPEEVAHLALQIGRLLLGSGADTAQVQISVEQFVAGFGQEAHVMVGYESILLTIIAGGQFRTKIGTLEIVNPGTAASTAVLTEMLALVASCFLMVTAIAVGIAVPVILTNRDFSANSKR